ncbi:unnamed protein product [Prorocentrum cordatum]|uniref:Rhodanese domain-containing protein n=1 Tax=Prorocentrum cordatum TaxID=2364126 RepID=A0ABN9UTB6_9DINO|nr:unnamed protein product [Polarella glacialis]
MDDFPAIPAPTPSSSSKLQLEKFLDALHGPAGAGAASGATLTEFSPKVLALDVRSPGEFEKGHIPGALNVPLFSDEERATVGTKYKQSGRYAAIRAGLGIVGPRMSRILEEVEQLGGVPGQRVLVYCWRGGMRSGSVSWLLGLCGFEVGVLEGGYRSYRRWCRATVGAAGTQPPAPVVVLGGCTGVGKTAVLLELAAQGHQVVDLEGAANHRGSAFGWMGQAPQPSNEAFENALALAARQADASRPMWLEHEGRHVGTCAVPAAVLGWVQAAPGGGMITLDMAQELRVQRLVEDYCSEACLQKEGWVEGLRQCISAKKGGLAKKLGGNRVKEALQLLEEGEWSRVAAMMLDYYDKLYKQWQADSASLHVVRVECSTADAAENAARALEALPEVLRQPSCPASAPACAEAVVGRAAAPTEPGGEVNDGWPRFEGRCHCGEVRVVAFGQPRAVSYCHCSIPERKSGTGIDFGSSALISRIGGPEHAGKVLRQSSSGTRVVLEALFAREQVATALEPGAQLQGTQSTRSVERQRCASCLSPMQAALFGGKLVAVPLALLGSWRGTGGGDLRPQHHMYYNDRVMDVVDGLPKYGGAVRVVGKTTPSAKDMVEGTAPLGGSLVPETDAPQTDQPCHGVFEKSLGEVR